MSRTELSFDNDYPPGLGFHTRAHERDHTFHASQQQHASSGAATAAQQDRRPSVAGLGTYGGTLSRSLAIQQQDHHREFVSPFSHPPELGGPNTNRHNPSSSIQQHLSGSSSPFLPFNHHSTHRPSPPLPLSTTSPIYPSSSPSDRDSLSLYRQSQSNLAQNTSPANSIATRSTLWWGELEPWMDEEYAKQVCGLMNWDPASIKVPHPAPDPSTGQQANNPGYCFLTFPTPAHAASVLAQISKSTTSGPLPMPNSSKPFVMNWASAVTSASPMSTAFPATVGPQTTASAVTQQYPKEYSIFVGDLAPETSNSDLVAVFRNPVLGLRNDREPKFIKPFLSCKSAKIMLDPVTGVSRGYGFVRYVTRKPFLGTFVLTAPPSFTDESDQQRALIEMHGLYCLSRPMRISAATAKFKAPQTLPGFEVPQVSFTPPTNVGSSSDASGQPVTIALPLPNAAQAKSVSAPIAAAGSNLSLSSNAASNSTSSGSFGGSHSNNSLSSGSGSSGSISTSAFTSSSDDMYSLDPMHPLKMASMNPFEHEAQLRQVLAQQAVDPSPRYVISEESWKHHAQARAILGNLIGPNGEQLTSTDPYNTTVFVGGLSPLISEDTLRTFFAPFGDIHYVKVPVGKHCGFVQFVRKADAERAIEKMQGFPIGGSRIRLSWGRSQYKAAQAAAQAAQAAALQTQYSLPPLPVGTISQDQALHILHKFSSQGYFNGSGSGSSSGGLSSNLYDITQDLDLLHYGGNEKEENQGPAGAAGVQGSGNGNGNANASGASSYGATAQRPDLHRAQSTFSPFSPDPNNLYMSSESVGIRRESSPYPSRLEALPHPSKAYAPGFFPMSQQSQQQQDIKRCVEQGFAHVCYWYRKAWSGGRYGFAEGSDSPTPFIVRPILFRDLPRARWEFRGKASQGHGQENDIIHDLNGTLASLELDRERSWKSPEVTSAGKRI
ncbi:hypothetical protein CPB84DRAFT_1750712 [Gymnopilus junonius]|uniref:RRM domain-containing protein n=1 Tax=Gymnopilus junonius TaxID=109634 RepID=A0A9P5TIX3_GYMJU|nr:hypothetical protein CPB84DRAFT_1750712 [Gymnopilus junonius]